MLRHAVPGLLLAAGLMGCAADQPPAPPPEVIARAAHVSDAPPSLTLVTVVNNRSNQGAHSALIVNASQRVLFDPAGSFRNSRLPERDDVIYGMSDSALEVFVDYHARETYRVVLQEVIVRPDQAEQALALVQQAGPVSQAMCSAAISGVLRKVDGFGDLPASLFPGRTQRAFARVPGVETRVIRDDSPDEQNRTAFAEAPI